MEDFMNKPTNRQYVTREQAAILLHFLIKMRQNLTSTIAEANLVLDDANESWAELKDLATDLGKLSPDLWADYTILTKFVFSKNPRLLENTYFLLHQVLRCIRGLVQPRPYVYPKTSEALGLYVSSRKNSNSPSKGFGVQSKGL